MLLIKKASRYAGRAKTRDGMTFDQRVIDSTGAFLVGELERLDPTLHEPLMSVSWGRDIDLREDVTIADEVSSFTQSSFASAAGPGAGAGVGNSKAWIGKSSDQIAGVSVDIAKIPYQLRLWALELKYTIPELESSARVGRPIDVQKFEALKMKYQMDVDEQVYIGDSALGDTGLVNKDKVTNVANVANGASGSPLWSQKTPDEILTDFNEILNSAWAASGYAQIPSRVLLPPAQFGYISTAKVSNAGNVSILKYVQDNSLLTTTGKGKLDIYPLKWLVGAGAGGVVGVADGHDRMVAYTKAKDRVRFPMTPLQRTNLQFESIYQKTTYFGRLGQVEMVYPETLAYRDGL